VSFKFNVKEEKYSGFLEEYICNARSTSSIIKREDLSDIVGWGEAGNGFVIKNL
jgi:hypothetical protein